MKEARIILEMFEKSSLYMKYIFIHEFEFLKAFTENECGKAGYIS